MTFLADEGLDYPLVKLLRNAGYNVLYAAEDYIAFTDEKLLEIAKNENRILLTKDKDFGELAIRSGQKTAGIVLIRIDKLNVLHNCVTVVKAIQMHKAELPNNFTVIQEDKIRIRTL